MANSVMQQEFKSFRKSFFHFSIFILVCCGISIGVFKGIVYLDAQKIQTKEETIRIIETELTKLGSEEKYNKLEFARKIEQENKTMPRSERISMIVEVLRKLQTMTYEGSNSIKLYDFTVTLDKMSLKGEVSNIALLYHSTSNGSYVNLIDTFKSLPFVTDVSIKEYDRNGKNIEFILDASLSLSHGIIQ